MNEAVARKLYDFFRAFMIDFCNSKKKHPTEQTDGKTNRRTDRPSKREKPKKVNKT